MIQPTALPASSSASGSAEKGFLSKMKHSKRRLVVFYGSQTGYAIRNTQYATRNGSDTRFRSLLTSRLFRTGEEFASRLSKEGAKYGLKGIAADPEECDMEDLSKIADLEGELEGPCLAVFCLATYGEGDPTDNAQEFFDWLQGSPGEVNGRI